MQDVRLTWLFMLLASCGPFACPAIAEAQVSLEIDLVCRSSIGATVENADEVCRELTAFLSETYPDMRFATGGTTPPRMEVEVTISTPRALGLRVAWVDAKGARSEGTPLRTSFFDRNSDPTLRRRFFGAFLQSNPLPF